MAQTQDALGSHNATRQAVPCDTLIFAASFVVFFVIALTGQLLGWHWRDWLPGAEGAKSIYGGVKAAVYTVMSHIQ